MNSGDVDAESAVAAGETQGAKGSGRSGAARATRAVRWAVESGAVAGVGGGVTVLRGLLALRRGERGRGLARLALGGLFVAIGIAQRRAGDGGTGVDQTDVVDTAPDLADVAEPTTGPDEHVGGRAASEVVDTAADVEDLTPGPEGDDAETAPDEEAEQARDASQAGEPGQAEGETADRPEREGAGGAVGVPEPGAYERLGNAAYDEYSREVPVPQPALNLGLLSPGSEVFWGVREADDAVIVSGQFDPLDDAEGVRYVGSSRLDDERTLSIPDVVTDHWDEVAGGGTAVVSGTDLVFATTDRLREDDQLLVVPGQWVDDVLGDGE